MSVHSENEIGKHSRITLGVACSILAVAIGGVITGIGMYDGICARIDTLQRSQFTKDDQLRWVLELKNENPSLNVPIPNWGSSDLIPPRMHGFSRATNENRMATIIIKRP